MINNIKLIGKTRKPSCKKIKEVLNNSAVLVMSVINKNDYGSTYLWVKSITQH